MKLTTLCYIEKDDKYLMIHRIKKKHDVNKDKWIGIGGKFERGESPEDCILRETKEETGLTLTSYRLRGVLTFMYNDDDAEMEYIFLYTADGFTGELADCNEGKHISMDTLARICETLNCEITDVIELVPDEPASTGGKEHERIETLITVRKLNLSIVQEPDAQTQSR